jgi:NADH-quinone oxidoreductase subunit F
MEQGKAVQQDLETLRFQTKFLAPGNTFCAFAPGAVEPLQSALKYFEGDFQRHIEEKGCPWR